MSKRPSVNNTASGNGTANKYEHALVYCRVSSEKQRVEGHGLDSQEHRCRVFAEQQGLTVEAVFRDSFSGGGDFWQRPAMRELLEYVDARPHVRYALIFDDMSRFARDTEFHLRLRREVDARQMKPLCPNFTFSDSPEGKFAEIVIAAKNEYERIGNRRQVIQKMKARMEAGYDPFARRRGYDCVKDPAHGKIKVPNREGLEVLKPALEGFAEGKLLRKVDVASYLVERGFWAKRRSPEKYIDQVSALLRDPFYAGFLEYAPWGVERRPGRHEPLISPETFEAIQARLRKPNATVRVRQDISDEFPMRGLVLCDACREPLTAAFCKKTFPYYWCWNKACALHGKSIRRADLEDAFEAVLQRGQLKPEIGEVVAAVFEAVWKDEVNSRQRQEARLRREIEATEDKIRGLTELARRAGSDRLRAVYEKQIEELAEEMEETRSESVTGLDLFIPFRTALSKATTLIESPYIVWQKLDARQKHGLYFFLFDQKIPYSKQEGFRTSEIPTAARLFEDFVLENSASVDTSHKTLNRLKTYLTRFWGYYETAPALQDAVCLIFPSLN